MKHLFEAMAKAFPEIEGATKDKNNPHFKSRYADLGSVSDAIKPALVKHGLFYAQKTHDRADGICVETIVGHSSGEVFSFGELYVPAAKRDPQGFGSALTYARRYSLMTAFGVCPEDDDGNAGTKALNGGGSGSGQGQTEGTVSQTTPVIDESQFAILTTLVEQSGADLKALCTYYKVPALNQLPAAQFDAVAGQLKSKMKKAA